MGQKGAKLTPTATQVAETFTQRLLPLGEISSKKMFGGHGIFANGKMFAIVDSSGGIFLKAADANLAAFEQAGSAKHGRMPYYAIPEAVLQDDEQLLTWAGASIAVAQK
ncbi:MAG: TfoX/Sxy family protein [Caldilineaceae bacterium]